MATQRSTAAVAQAGSQTAQQRGTEATRQLREVFNLPATRSDATILATAVAEVAAEEGRRNASFASAVSKRYNELVALYKPSAARTKCQKQELPPLVAIRHDTTFREIDPFKPPDLQYLIHFFGVHQLARALQDYAPPQLKVTAARIEAEHPGTKPTNRGQKQPLIDYIVKYST